MTNSFSPTMARPDSEVEPDLRGDPIRDPEIHQVVRSAGYSVECPAALFYSLEVDGRTVCASFGAGPAKKAKGFHRVLFDAPQLWPDGLLIIDDIASRQDFVSTDPDLFGADSTPIRFLAAASVNDCNGVARGILVVADGTPRAGLSAAKKYVLRTHAAQLAALLELRALRERVGHSGAAALLGSDTERLRLLESVVVNAHDAVLITESAPIDVPGPRIVYCNRAFTVTTGYSEAEVLGKTPRLLQSLATSRKTLDNIRRALSRWEPIEVEVLNRKKDGTEFWVELSIAPVANDKGWFTHWVSVQRDVSGRKTAEETATRARIAEAENSILETEIRERKRAEAKLLYAAFHDGLTHLRNREFFLDSLTLALSRGKSASGFDYAVIFLDMDGFKLVNDSLGHRAGDLLLIEVAARLRKCIRRQDTLARMGGDEFAILVESIDTDPVAMLAERILESMRKPWWLDQQEIFLSCSVGVVEGAERYNLPEELMRDADIAMYKAKRGGPGGYTVFADSMHASAVVALSLLTDLRNAIPRDEFFLLYQPICDSATGRITGLEALIRWQNPVRGLVAPMDFIPTAERNGLIQEIGQWVLREACAQMRVWQDQFRTRELRLNVNVSAEELTDRRFITDVRETLAATGLEPHSLQLELTEGIFLQGSEFVDELLSGLRALGARIALDDFGTGYSSLGYIDRYKIDTIKIDRSFIGRMLDQPRTMAVVEAIIQLGRTLALDIVAEGVEDEVQLQALRGVGCPSIQGYHLARPMPAADVAAALAKHYETSLADDHALV